jgi:hypothetical protein
MDPRGAEARRFRDIVRASLDGIAELDHAAVSLARASALATLRLDNGDVDDFNLVRLAGVIARSQQALAAMKAKQAEPAGSSSITDLKRHLAELAKQG